MNKNEAALSSSWIKIWWPLGFSFFSSRMVGSRRVHPGRDMFFVTFQKKDKEGGQHGK